VSATISEVGTSESEWIDWLAVRDWPDLDLRTCAGGRIVVLAAHPDDEILGVGGLIARLAQHHPIVMVWATDGEASHPHSQVFGTQELAAVRREESRRALVRLGITPQTTHHLGLPDGGLAARAAELEGLLAAIVDPHDVVISTWEDDGHPDHEALGRAARRVSVRTWQYPIWAWHWAAPGDPRVAWERLRIVRDIDVEAKAAAVAQFVSQIEPIGPSRADAAILPPSVLAHFARSHELVFV
jgi:LmbE family N-acetylglucosaminyl deacetylase